MAWNLDSEARSSRMRSATRSAMVLNAAASWPTSSSESTPTRAERSPPAMASPAAVRRRRWRVSHKPQSELENDGDYDRGSRDHQAAAQQTGTSSVQERCGDGVAQQPLALAGEDERDLRVEAAVGFEIGGRCVVLQRAEAVGSRPSPRRRPCGRRCPAGRGSSSRLRFDSRAECYALLRSRVALREPPARR